MLVLTRRIDEEIVIAGSIRVKVLAVQGQKVRLGVRAPASVAVDRQEVHDRRAEFVGHLGLLANALASDPVMYCVEPQPEPNGKVKPYA
jgi:carbon storage regulator CsrA